jgi:hypothetical protein
MSNLDLVDWTMQEVRQLSPAHPMSSKLESTPSLSGLWEVLESERSKPNSIDTIFRIASAPSGQRADDTSTAPPSSELIADPKPDTVSNLPVSRQTAPDVGGAPNSDLLRAIVEPDIQTAPVDRDRAIALRWVLRDIKGNRLKWWPVSQHDMRDLIDMGLVEMRNETPVLTNKGVSAIV